MTITRVLSYHDRRTAAFVRKVIAITQPGMETISIRDCTVYLDMDCVAVHIEYYPHKNAEVPAVDDGSITEVLPPGGFAELDCRRGRTTDEWKSIRELFCATFEGIADNQVFSTKFTCHPGEVAKLQIGRFAVLREDADLGPASYEDEKS